MNRRTLDQIALWFLSIAILALVLLSVGIAQLPGYLIGSVIAMWLLAGVWWWRNR